MAKLFIEDLKLAGQRVLMRVDFNVPVKDGKVENDKRLRASLPSIRYVLDQGASLVLMSHLGRPDGQQQAKYSLSAAPTPPRRPARRSSRARSCCSRTCASTSRRKARSRGRTAARRRPTRRRSRHSAPPPAARS